MSAFLETLKLWIQFELAQIPALICLRSSVLPSAMGGMSEWTGNVRNEKALEAILEGGETMAPLTGSSREATQGGDLLGKLIRMDCDFSVGKIIHTE